MLSNNYSKRVIVTGILFFSIASFLYSQPTTRLRSSDDHKTWPVYPLSQPVTIIITGKVPDSVTKVEFGVADQTKLGKENTVKQIVEVNNNQFRYSFKATYPVFVRVSCVNNGVIALNSNAAFFNTAGILVEPGDSICIDASLSRNYNQITFSGRGSEKQKCIQSIFRNSNRFKAFVSFRGDADSLFSLNESVTKFIFATVDSFKSRVSPSARSIILGSYVPMLTLDYTEILDGTPRSVWKGIPSDVTQRNSYKQKGKELASLLNLKDPNLIYAATVNFLEAFCIKRIECDLRSDKLQPGTVVSVPAVLDELHGKFPKGQFKQKLLAGYLTKLFSKRGPTEEVDQALQSYLQTNDTSNIFVGQVYRHFMEQRSQLIAGAPAFPFALKDTLGNIHSMDDFKGKVVVLDFMFNGCSGCRQLVPALELVEKAFEGNPSVQFISISTDEKVEGRNGWKEGIGKASPVGALQLYTNGEGAEHAIIKHYYIYAYPTLVLIDQQGKLVSARAPDPRSGREQNLINLIKKTLQNNSM